MRSSCCTVFDLLEALLGLLSLADVAGDNQPDRVGLGVDPADTEVDWQVALRFPFEEITLARMEESGPGQSLGQPLQAARVPEPEKSSSSRISQAASFSSPVNRRAVGLRSTIICVLGSNRKKASLASRKRLRLISTWRYAGFMGRMEYSLRLFTDELYVTGTGRRRLIERVSTKLVVGLLEQLGFRGAACSAP